MDSPVFNHPWALTREALRALGKGGPPDARTSHLMRDVNPVDGGRAMPTIATLGRLLPAGDGDDRVPFSNSDRVVHEKLGFWRAERRAA